MRIKEIIKLITPPILLKAATRLCGKDNSLRGNYSSWSEAMALCTGYDDKAILEKTREAVMKVKRGEAVYERDSVLFDKVIYSWPLLAGLMCVAAQNDGVLNVLDFGGSLGSTYFQNRAFLEKLREVRWNIIEQPAHVKTGKKMIEDDHIKFYFSAEECFKDTKPNVIILSNVLQYLKEPYKKLGELLSLKVDNIIIDRTPFWAGEADMLCIQRVPRHIYEASYPVWILSEERFNAAIDGWAVVSEYENTGMLATPVKTEWKGMMLVRRGPK